MNPHWRNNYPDGMTPGDEEGRPDEQEESPYAPDREEPREDFGE